MSSRKKVTLTTIRKMKKSGEKITMLTAYDASFAKVVDDAGVDTILVGDSLGMVVQGNETTVPVTVNDIIYHGKAVARGAKNALIILDLPFMSYTSPDMALKNSMRLLQEGSGHMVKLEGGAAQAETIRQLSAQGVAVCAHLGLLPQSVNKIGGYKVQGKTKESRKQIIDDAMLLQEAGADMIVLECVPVDLAKELTNMLDIPTIGIGAGPDCNGQVLVMHDLLGMTSYAPKFTKDYMKDSCSLQDAFATYCDEVKSGAFPAEEHCFF